MAKIAITRSPRIVKNGGPITSTTYKSHATNLWMAGALLKLSSGLLTPVTDTSGGAAEIDTDDTGTAGVRLFVALEHHLTAGSVYVKVQEIQSDTILEVQLCASGSTDPTVANVTQGTSYTGYQLTGASQSIDVGGTIATYSPAGRDVWGIDVDDTTKPVFQVCDEQPNWDPHNPDADDDYGLVWVKVLSAILG